MSVCVLCAVDMWYIHMGFIGCVVFFSYSAGLRSMIHVLLKLIAIRLNALAYTHKTHTTYILFEKCDICISHWMYIFPWNTRQNVHISTYDEGRRLVGKMRDTTQTNTHTRSRHPNKIFKVNLEGCNWIASLAAYRCYRMIKYTMHLKRRRCCCCFILPSFLSFGFH